MNEGDFTYVLILLTITYLLILVTVTYIAGFTHGKDNAHKELKDEK